MSSGGLERVGKASQAKDAGQFDRLPGRELDEQRGD